MQGSRLFLTSEDQSVATAWQRELQSRMRARKLFDRYPGTEIVVHPWGEPTLPYSHADRIYQRDLLTRGSIMQVAPWDDIADMTLEERKTCCDEMIDEWLTQQKRANTLQWYVGGAGFPYPKILIVHSHTSDGKPGDGAELSEVLNHAGLREAELYFMHTQVLEPFDFSCIGAYEVVALGYNAMMKVTSCGIKSFVAFPHPYFLATKMRKSLPTWGERLRKQVEHVL